MGTVTGEKMEKVREKGQEEGESNKQERGKMVAAAVLLQACWRRASWRESFLRYAHGARVLCDVLASVRGRESWLSGREASLLLSALAQRALARASWIQSVEGGVGLVPVLRRGCARRHFSEQKMMSRFLAGSVRGAAQRRAYAATVDGARILAAVCIRSYIRAHYASMTVAARERERAKLRRRMVEDALVVLWKVVKRLHARQGFVDVVLGRRQQRTGKLNLEMKEPSESLFTLTLEDYVSAHGCGYTLTYVCT